MERKSNKASLLKILQQRGYYPPPESAGKGYIQELLNGTKHSLLQAQIIYMDPYYIDLKYISGKVLHKALSESKLCNYVAATHIRGGRVWFFQTMNTRTRGLFERAIVACKKNQGELVTKYCINDSELVNDMDMNADEREQLKEVEEMRQFGKRKRVKTKNAVQIRYSTKSKYSKSMNIAALESLMEGNYSET